MRFWYLLLLLPSVALAKSETWPRAYNDGVTAYHSNDFARAATLFESATASPDRALQQRALYNLGNTTYRLGEVKTPQAQQLWQRAIKSYENAIALDPHDTDAKFNHDFVEKKLEELKKQQQQQNQQNQQDKKQDQKKDDQQQKQEDQKQPSRGRPQRPDDKQLQEQKQQQQQPQPSQDQQKAEQKQKDELQKQQAQEQKESPSEQQPQPQSGQPENDEKRQAAALLDNLREDERNWNFFPEVQMKDLKDSGEPAKDW
jgi:Ca-activated chloride channel family protein